MRGRMAEVCYKSPRQNLGRAVISLAPGRVNAPNQVAFCIPYLMYKVAIGTLFFVAELCDTC